MSGAPEPLRLIGYFLEIVVYRFVEVATGFGEFYGPVQAIEQLHAEVSFQGANLTADRFPRHA